MTWNRRNTAQQRVRRKADYRHNIYMFNKFCTLGTDFTLSDFRLRFRLRKTRFTDLLKILDKGLSTLYKERSATYNVATSFIALRFYSTFVRGELWSRSLAIYIWCFCIFCMHWTIHKVSRVIAKRKEHSLSFPENLHKYTKRKYQFFLEGGGVDFLA